MKKFHFLLFLTLLIGSFLAACKVAPRHPIEREWVEVRVESLDGKSTSLPSNIILKFKSNRRFKADNPGSFYRRTVKGEYTLEDSTLVLIPPKGRGRALWDIITHTHFKLIEVNAQKLVLREFVKGTDLSREMLTFIPKETFDQMSPREVRNQYSLTTQDSLNKIENYKRYEEEKERKKAYRYTAHYPGGKKAIDQFLKSNLRYPIDHQYRRMVRVDFVVTPDGTTMDIKTGMQGEVLDYYEQEAERVIQSMMGWKPAFVDGKLRNDNQTILVIFDGLDNGKLLKQGQGSY